ncbi:hypothetical protein [Legionella shakespearei]|uniref:Uncharacterized protein n=1 Tax=Legionella shakespearei DSM 23087 TaxID=1122169 RepID=A0A0W0Z3I3_9GAMM|nr:hypothetical protein [Legionella shakespearei]KTD63318.1 hypothetical protein Lsha_0738 [Legionella shakespearei DSM 23087]
MGKEKRDHLALYKPLPYKARFWLYSENCYTEEELNLREWLLKTRAQSGIHQDYLKNASPWFADNDQALINPYEHAWFYSDAFKTRHVLSRDDFHVQPVDRLQWPALYDLMQKVGDYLLIRNQNLPAEHLNQPMNFILLDLNLILKSLSQNTDMGHVKEQLELITQYLRTIEKNISPLIGSDRLFLANFRFTIDEEIHPYLNHMIESQQLKERLGDLSKVIKKLSTDRNRILHFALNINQVNPHPYDFSQPQLEDSPGFPTQAAKKCGASSTELIADPMPVLHLTMEQLHDCPNFKLISMNEDILNHYASAIADLNELERFQKVISQIMDLLGQAGEVYTIYQFNEQMLSLLKQIDGFIDNSSKHIDAILHANTQEYHKAIETEQNLSLWQRWFSEQKELLQTYIKNQDTLAQFPSSSSDLAKTNKMLKSHVNQVISHLSQPRSIETSFEAIADKAQELDRLMGSMHQWIKIQHEMKGLPAPNPPKLLQSITAAEQIPRPQIPVIQTTPEEEPSPQAATHYPPLFSPQTAPSPNLCAESSGQCQSDALECPTANNNMLYFGAIALIPIGLIVLYLIYNWSQKKESSIQTLQGTEDEFELLKTRFEDLLVNIRRYEQEYDQDLTDEYETILHSFNELVRKAKSGVYHTEELKETIEDLNYFYQETCQKEDKRLNMVR